MMRGKGWNGGNVIGMGDGGRMGRVDRDGIEW